MAESAARLRQRSASSTNSSSSENAPPQMTGGMGRFSSPMAHHTGGQLGFVPTPMGPVWGIMFPPRAPESLGIPATTTFQSVPLLPSVAQSPVVAGSAGVAGSAAASGSDTQNGNGVTTLQLPASALEQMAQRIGMRSRVSNGRYLGRRAFAEAVDMLLVGFLVTLYCGDLQDALALYSGFESANLDYQAVLLETMTSYTARDSALFFLVAMLYHSIVPALTRGRTLGKFLTGLVIVQETSDIPPTIVRFNSCVTKAI